MGVTVSREPVRLRAGSQWRVSQFVEDELRATEPSVLGPVSSSVRDAPTSVWPPLGFTAPISSITPDLTTTAPDDKRWRGVVVGVFVSGSSVPLTLSEVDRRAPRGTPSGVRKVLLRLVNEGVVLSVPGGYLLNREHVAAGAVEALVTLRAEFLLRLRDEVALWTYHADLVGLFGSHDARETRKATSTCSCSTAERLIDSASAVLAS